MPTPDNYPRLSDDIEAILADMPGGTAPKSGYPERSAERNFDEFPMETAEYPDERGTTERGTTHRPSIDRDELTASERVALATMEFQREMAESQRKMKRLDTLGRTAGLLKIPIGVVAVGTAVVLAINWLFPGGDHASPPSDELPTPEAAMNKLGSADTLVFAVGEVEAVANASLRVTGCLPADAWCPDMHMGHDVSTTTRSDTQYAVDGETITYDEMEGPDGMPIVLAVVEDNEIAQDLVNPVSTHPVVDSQLIANIVGIFSSETGVGKVLDIATAQAEHDIRIKAADFIMDAGDQRGDAVVGAIAKAARSDIRRLISLLEDTDPEHAQVIEGMIEEGRPIAVDMGSDGFTVQRPEPVEELHLSRFGAHVDLNFGKAKGLTVSEEVHDTIKEWTDPSNVLFIRHESI